MSIALEDGGAYQSLQIILQDAFGVVIGEGRNHSILAKLKPVIAEFNLGTLEGLVSELQKSGPNEVKNSVLQAITAHEDAWFTPEELFRLLDDYLLAEIMKSGRHSYRIWVIGSGAGQLPYSLAMNIHQAIKQANSSTKVRIEATDVNANAVDMAAKGEYEPTSLEGMPDTSRNKFMGQRSGLWQVRDEIRSMVSFSTCNLHEDIEHKGHFDLIICVGVLVYFSVPMRTKLLRSFARLLDPSGVLVAGLSEPVLPFNDQFDMVRLDSGIFYRQRAH